MNVLAPGIGLRSQIEEIQTMYYESLTREKLDLIIVDYQNRISSTVPRYTMYTNELGMISFEISMLGCWISIPNVYYDRPDKGNYRYVISIGKKQGLVKAYLNKKTNEFDVKVGTKFLLSTKKLDKGFFEKIKRMLDGSDLCS